MGSLRARWIALLVVAAAALYLNWLMLRPFVGVLTWAAVLVIVFYPAHRRILARTKSPGWSALLSSLLVIFAVLLPLALVTAAVVNEAAKFAEQFQQGGGLAGLLDPNSQTTGPLLQWAGQYVDVQRVLSQEAIAGWLKGVSGRIASSTLGVVGGLLGAVVQVFFIIFTMYYLFRDGEPIRHALYDVLPLERKQSREIFMRTKEVVSASVYGVLVIAFVQGALGGLAFWALGLPSPLLWAVVMMLFSLIPVAGAFIVWVPAAVYLALSGHYYKAAFLAAWGALVIGSADNFLRPKLVGDKTRLHELLIFFSVLGGLQVFGVLGIVLGPVIVAVTLALVDVIRHADRPPGETDEAKSLTETQDDLRATG